MKIPAFFKNHTGRFRVRWQYLAVLAIGAVLGMYATMSWQKHPARAVKMVAVNSRGMVYSIVTESPDVGGMLAEQGLDGQNSQVVPGKDSALTNGMRIDYRPSVPVTVIDGGVPLELSTTAQTVGEVVSQAGLALGPKDQLIPDSGTLVGTGAKIYIQRVEEFEEENGQEDDGICRCCGEQIVAEEDNNVADSAD